MKRELPADRERFERWRDNWILSRRESVRTMNKIPAILVHNCWHAIELYYGGPLRAIWAMAANEFHLWAWGKFHSFTLWICDSVGWTKIYHYPETDGMWSHDERHGWKCSGSPNCGDTDCISRSIPAWFKRLTRWED